MRMIMMKNARAKCDARFCFRIRATFTSCPVRRGVGRVVVLNLPLPAPGSFRANAKFACAGRRLGAQLSNGRLGGRAAGPPTRPVLLDSACGRAEPSRAGRRLASWAQRPRTLPICRRPRGGRADETGRRRAERRPSNMLAGNMKHPQNYAHSWLEFARART